MKNTTTVQFLHKFNKIKKF